jgi:tRNA pseudouridine38/39 synthase
MVAVLFLIGAKKERPEVVPWLLDVQTNPRKPLYDMASELPLVLYDCGFEEITFTYSHEVVQKLLYNFESIWNNHIMKGMLSRAFIGGIINDYQRQEDQKDGSEIKKNQPLLPQQCDYEPLLIYTKAPYQSLAVRTCCMSYEEKLNSLNSRKLALRSFHDERKIEASENPDAFNSQRREAALKGLAKARSKQ